MSLLSDISIFKRLTNRLPPGVDVTVVTPDDRFFSSLLYAADRTIWRPRWMKSIEGAVRSLARHPSPIVIYDCRTAVAGWEVGILTLALQGCQPSVVLVVQFPDEALWRRALDHGAYDVVAREGDRRLLFKTMHFALLHRTRGTVSGCGSETLAPAGRLG